MWIWSLFRLLKTSSCQGNNDGDDDDDNDNDNNDDDDVDDGNIGRCSSSLFAV